MLNSTVLAAVVLLSPLAASATEGPQGPFRDVPLTHWAYSAVQGVARQGWFTGYPEGTFSGRRALTRYEFAVAIQRLLAETQRGRAAASAVPTGRYKNAVVLRKLVTRHLRLPAERAVNIVLPTAQVNESLLQLAGEFKAELVMLGADADQVVKTLRQTLTPPPPLAPVAPGEVPPPKPEAEQSAAWKEGVKRAREEWADAQVVLYTYGFPGPSLSYDPLLGVPLKGIAGCIVDERILDLDAAHDEEVYRLVLQHGLPPNSRHRWSELVADPRSIWSDPKQVRFVLDPQHRESFHPGGDGFVRLETAGRVPSLAIRYGKRGFPLELPILEREAQRVEIVWGPSGSEQLFLRFRESPQWGGGTAYLVLDLRTQNLLNSAFDKAPLPN